MVFFPPPMGLLMNCQHPEVAGSRSVSLEIRCRGVIRPESLRINHADGFLTERPNYADPLAANSMRIYENPLCIAL